MFDSSLQARRPTAPSSADVTINDEPFGCDGSSGRGTRRAHRGLRSAAPKTLNVLTAEEGGAEHCQVDNRLLAISYIADWISANV